MNCNFNSSLDSNNEGLSFTEKESDKEGSTYNLDLYIEDGDALQSNAESSNSHMKYLVDNKTTNTMKDSLELNLNPVVWQKFQFLISVLKDIQLNIQEMDNLIIDRNREPDDQSFIPKHSFPAASVDNTSLDPLINVADSSKTDETKLNEILCLLHRITKTLSAFEENPLLREDLDRGNDYLANQANECNTSPALDSGVNRSCDNLKTILGESEERRGITFDRNRSEDRKRLRNDPFEHEPSLDWKGKESGEKISSHPPHRFTKETISLRNEIEAVLKRKELLDERLNRFIIERQEQKHKEAGETPEKDNDYDDLEKAAGADEMIVNFSLGFRDAEHPVVSATSRAESDSTSIDDGKSTDDYEKKKQNDLFIEELRKNESEIPGLGGGGLSSEINSLNITIREILKENHELHSLCNEFSERINVKVRNKSKRSSGMVTGGSLSSKSLKNKNKDRCLNTSLSQCIMENTEVNHPNTKSDLINQNESAGQNLMSNFAFSDSYLKVSFDNKIRAMMKEQTDMIKHLQKDKRTYDEKYYNLEQMVDDLMKVNRETRTHLVEELRFVDMENCRLEDKVHLLQRENCKLTKERNKLKEGVKSEVNHDHALNRRLVYDDSSHSFGPEHIRGQVREKDIANHLVSKVPLKQPSVQRRHSLRTSGSQNELNTEMESLTVPAFSSLPLIVSEDSCNEGGRNSSPMEDEEELANHPTNTTAAARLCSEVNGLKSRVDYLDVAYLNHQRDKNQTHSDKKDMDASDVSLRVESLMKEKNADTSQMEELMGIARNLAFHFRATRQELISVRRENKALLEKLEARSDKKHNHGVLQEMDDSRPKQHFSWIAKLQERCHYLQMELECAHSRAQVSALEKQRLSLEKEQLNEFFTSSLAHIEEENTRLQTSLRKLEGTNEESSLQAPRDDTSHVPWALDQEQVSSNQYEMKKVTIVAQVHNEAGGGGLKEEDEDASAAGPVEDRPKMVSREGSANAAWHQSVLWLQRCFVEEKLHSQLLEAAEKESSARVAVLEESVREKGEKYRDLLSKYKKLHSMLVATKFEKKANKKILKECTTKIEQFNVTTTAIEDNYNVMLSSLGNNIGIAVEILSSHLYLSPSHVHPSPDLAADPAFWFAAQCSRLRWLQSQLRKLCVHSWKMNHVGPCHKRKRKKPQIRSDDTRLPHNSSTSSLDPDRGGTPPPGLLSTSQSSPNLSPKGGREERTRSKLKQKIEGEMIIEEETSSSPSLQCSLLLSSLNEAEVSLTNEQTKLFQNKRSQFDTLVGILNQNATRPDIGRRLLPPEMPFAKGSFSNEGIESTDNSNSETFDMKSFQN